ncbi:hypothetical protein BRADI_3g06071v3 [Brachypodium distachyon]|uniref:Uncharacterized protein n=1 Tax=Brachypodium distachyon TaxID=15368 RepID=A0A2K2CVI7_BRADI|nr:hypothetical protein BRADI_3g06071v3 [Brachypodium distachyon]
MEEDSRRRTSAIAGGPAGGGWVEEGGAGGGGLVEAAPRAGRRTGVGDGARGEAGWWPAVEEAGAGQG